MKIDLTCPVELWQYAIPTEDDAECTFVMNNLSDKVVVSVQVTLACFDQEDNLLFKQTERIQGLKAGVGERFSIVLLPTQWREVEGVDLSVEKVWFDDATIWRKGNAPLTLYTTNAMPAGRQLDELRFVAGKDAVGYPEMQLQAWLCVCGRANALDSDRCCRCERRRDSVFASFTRDNVSHVIAAHEQKLAQTARKAREENNAVQEKMEKQRIARRRRRKQAVRLSTTLACVATLAAVAIFWGIPTLRYNMALGLLSEGRYADARAAFGEMGGYRDAQTQMKACDYQAALTALHAGDEAGLSSAQAGFAELGDYLDSADLRQQAAYALGELYLRESRYEAAADAFQLLGSYQDSAEKRSEAVYRQALALIDAGNYTSARVLLNGIASYAETPAQLVRCDYLEGKEYFDAGEWAAAVEKLSPLGDYEDAARLAQQANYAQAEERMAAGEFEEAGSLYLLAGDYGDARAKANDCLYQLAQELKTAGEYERASVIFLRISDYLDSEGQAQSCIYAQAEALMQAQDYAGAAALLNTITTYSQTANALYECNYRLAMDAIEAGDMARAETLLEDAGGYGDGDRQLRIVRYQLAEEAYAAGNYEDARIRYNALGSYRDSVTMLRRCNYAIATAALEAGDYAAAISGFEALGNYQESRTLLEEARYQQAMALQTGGNTQAAVEALTAMGDSDIAQSALANIAMTQGAELEAAGDYEGAAAMYETIDTNEARARANACRYILAGQLAEAGDLPGAGAAFNALGNYEDAAERSAGLYAQYYGSVVETARDAMAVEDYPAVIVALEGFSMTDLPQGYQDLPDIYNEACYQYAEQLYRDGKPYEAMPYYQRVGDYRDTAASKLERRAYLVLGEWVSGTGRTVVFNADGTCDLMGEALHFRVSNFSLYTGADENSMTITHKLSAIDKTSMSLRDIRDGQDVVYKFERVGEWALPEPAPAPATTALTEPVSTPAPQPTPADDFSDMLVTEDGDEGDG